MTTKQVRELAGSVMAHIEPRDRIAARLVGAEHLYLPAHHEAVVAKNILIFSDGTGQAGGLTPDENVSNIYMLFRATRWAQTRTLIRANS